MYPQFLKFAKLQALKDRGIPLEHRVYAEQLGKAMKETGYSMFRCIDEARAHAKRYLKHYFN